MNSKSFIPWALMMALVFALVSAGVTREVPTGTLTGIVTLSESAKRFADAQVVIYPQEDVQEWAEDIVRPVLVKTDADGLFVARRLPVGRYRVEVMAKNHALPSNAVTTAVIAERQITTLDLPMEPTANELELYVNQHVYAPDESPEVFVTGFDPEQDAKVQIYRIPFEEVVREGEVSRIISPISRADSPTEAGRQPDFELTVPLKQRDSEGIFNQLLKLPLLDQGVYWMTVRTSQKGKGNYLMVTKNALVTKADSAGGTAFVTDLKTGVPIAGAKVSIVRGSRSIPVGTTSREGLVRFQVPADRGTASDSQPIGLFSVVAQAGDSLAVANAMFQRQDDNRVYYVRTDRPVYRPGDDVEFSMFVRERVSSGLQLPTGITTGQMQLRSEDNEVVDSMSVSLDRHGRASGKFKLPAARVGSFWIRATFGESNYDSMVMVSAYRKPEFRIVVAPVKKNYLAGEVIEMKVSCQYYFGGPVVGATISGNVSRRQKWERMEGAEDDEDSDDYEDSSEGEYVGDVSGTTNEKGEAILRLDPKQLADESPAERIRPPFLGDAVYKFEISGSETGDRTFDGSGQVDVLQGAYAVTTELDRGWIEPGTSAQATITVIDRESGKPVPGAEVTVQGASERYQARSVTYLEDLSTKIATDAQGRARLSVQPKVDGSYRIRAVVADKGARRITSETWLDVWSGASEWNADSGADLKMTLDKKSYSAGDTARVLVRSKQREGAVMISVERERLEWVRVVKLENGTAQVDIPVEATWLPNASISATTVYKKSVITSEETLNVSRAIRSLDVKVTPSTDITRPGQPVSFDVLVTDAEGQPVVTPVVLGVVDEAVYAIREDSDRPLRTLYPRAWSQVVTNHSLVELYLDGGDKGVKPSEIRTAFRDTAAFSPTVMTDSTGRATVQVDLPDNVTSWRATAVAISDDSRAGKGRGSVIARKPLMIRLSSPTYFSKGDKVRISASVNNLTGTELPVTVRLLTKGIQAPANTVQEIRAASDRATIVTWEILATQAGQAELLVTANGGESYQDGMKTAVNVRPMTITKTDRWTGHTGPGTSLDIPSPGAGVTTLHVRASEAAGLTSTLNALIGYPYGCTEQTMSRFMPAVVATGLVAGNSQSKLKLQAELPNITTAALARLSEFQHGDGGWGWWQYDESEPEMTGIVLDGLQRARVAGVSVSPAMVNRGLNYARYRLESPVKASANSLAILARAWVQNEVSDDSLRALDRLAAMRPTSLSAQAEIALGYAYAAPQRPRYAGAALAWADELLKKARFDRSQPWTDEDPAAGWYQGLQVERAARLLEALLIVAPSDERIHRIATWLGGLQGQDGWWSTRDTNAAEVALVSYVKSKQATQAFGKITVKAGSETTVLDVTPENVLELNQSIQLTSKDVQVVTEGVSAFATVETVRELSSDSPDLNSAQSGIQVKAAFHKLTTERNSSGQLFLTHASTPSTSFQAGELLHAVIEWNCDRPEEFLMVEVPFPSSLKFVETDSPEYWNYWFTGLQILDDRAGILIRRVTQGKSKLVLNFRAEMPGVAGIPPVKVFPMYWPERAAYSSPLRTEVTPSR